MHNLLRVKDRYYFNIRVPKDLLHVFNKKELRVSLHTSSRKHAKVIVLSHSYKLERIFTLARCGMLNDEQIQKIIRAFLRDALRNFEDGRASGINVASDKATIDKLIRAYEIMWKEDNESLMHNRLENVQPWLDSSLDDQGIIIDKESFDYGKLCREALKARKEFWKIESERLAGNYNNEYDKVVQGQMLQQAASAPPLSPSSQPESKPAPTVRTLKETARVYVQAQSEKKGWSYQNLKENEKTFSLACAILGGDRDIKTLDYEDFKQLSDTIRKLPPNFLKKPEYKGKSISAVIAYAEARGIKPIAQKTFNKNVLTMSALWKWCADAKRQWVTANYASGFKETKRRKDEQRRKPYDIDDLKKLLALPIYTPEGFPSKRPERFWIPLIALFTGARLNEICQMRLTDIHEVEGVLCFDINEEENDQSTKNPNSIRMVPVHPTLIDIGLLRYLENVKKEKENPKQQLWSNLTYTEGNGYGGSFSKWWGSYARKYVTDDPLKVFHSTRHTVATTLKKKRVDGQMRSELLGQKPVTSTDQLGYSEPYDPSEREEDLGKLRYADLDFSGIKYPANRTGNLK